MTCSPQASSPGSAGWTSASNAPASAPPGCAKPTSGSEASSPPTGPECPSTTTYARSHVRNTTDDSDRWREQEVANALTAEPLNGIHGHTLIASTSSTAASPARTSASPDGAEDSPASDPACSTSSPASPTLFDPPGCSSRTYPDCSPRTMVGTSASYWERWPTSGTAWRGGCSMHVSSESPNAAVECSLSDVLLTPEQAARMGLDLQRYALSARAARGILRRAAARGRALPPHLEAALRTTATRCR